MAGRPRALIGHPFRPISPNARARRPWLPYPAPSKQERLHSLLRRSFRSSALRSTWQPEPVHQVDEPPIKCRCECLAEGVDVGLRKSLVGDSVNQGFHHSAGLDRADRLRHAVSLDEAKQLQHNPKTGNPIRLSNWRSKSWQDLVRQRTANPPSIWIHSKAVVQIR